MFCQFVQVQAIPAGRVLKIMGSLLLFWLVVICVLKVADSFKPPITQRSQNKLLMSSRFPNLEKTLRREYASFFSPMERRFYTEDVAFVDPMTSFTGIDKYQNNVDMLGGRTTLGKLLFSDASIVLHNIKDLNENQIQTRWTLQVDIKFLPWRPRAKFTGVSRSCSQCRNWPPPPRAG